MSWYNKKVKTAGAEDVFQGMTSHSVQDILQNYPDDIASLTKEQLRNIDQQTGMHSYIGALDKAKMFLKYPSIVYYSIYELQRLIERVGHDEDLLRHVWEKIKKYSLKNYSTKYKINHIPYNVPDFIIQDLCDNYHMDFSADLALDIFEQSMTKDVHPRLFEILKQMYPSIWEQMSSPSLRSAMNAVQSCYSFPSPENLEIMKKMIETMIFTYNDRDKRKQKEKARHENKVYQTLWNQMSAFGEQERALLEEAKEDRIERSSYSSDRWPVKEFEDPYPSVTVLEILTAASEAVESGQEFFNDELNIRVNFYTVGNEKVPYVTVFGNHFNPKDFEKIINFISPLTDNELRVTMYSGSTFGVQTMDGDKSVESHIKTPLSYDPDNMFRAETNKSIFATILNNIPKSHSFDKIYEQVFDRFARGEASEQEYMELARNPLFHQLTESVSNHAGSLYVNEKELISEEEYLKIENRMFSSYVPDNLLKLYSNIIQNMPNRVRVSFERRTMNAGGSNFDQTYNMPMEVDKPLGNNMWYFLCSGEFSYDFVEGWIEKWPSDAKKVQDKIKTRAGDQYDSSLRGRVDELIQKNERELHSGIKEFLIENGIEPFFIQDIPELQQFAEEFLTNYLKGSDDTRYSHAEGGVVPVKDYAISELKRVHIYRINPDQMIKAFGDDQLMSAKIHPSGIAGCYFPKYSIFSNNPTILIYTKKNQMDISEFKTIAGMLGMRPVEKDQSIDEEWTLWHEVSHAVFDAAHGGFESDKNYSKSTEGWMNDVEEIMVFSTGNYQYIIDRVRDVVDRSFPEDPKMMSGYLSHMKRELIETFPMEFFGKGVEEAKAELDDYVEEEKISMLAEENIEEAKQTLVDIFGKYLMGVYMESKVSSFTKMDSPNTIGRPSEYEPPEVYDDYMPTQKDKYISEMQSDPDYQTFITNLRKKFRNNQGDPSLKSYSDRFGNPMLITTIYDLVRFIFDPDFYSISDIDVNSVNKLFYDIIPPSLYKKVVDIVKKEKEYLDSYQEIPDAPVNPEDAKELGEMIYDTNRELGEGWQWLASRGTKWYKRARLKTANYLDSEDEQRAAEEYFEIGHDDGPGSDNSLWIWSGSGELEVEYQDAGTHGMGFPQYRENPDVFWKGRYDSDSHTVSVVPPNSMLQSRMAQMRGVKIPARLISLLEEEFGNPKIAGFYTSNYSSSQDYFAQSHKMKKEAFGWFNAFWVNVNNSEVIELVNESHGVFVLQNPEKFGIPIDDQIILDFNEAMINIEEMKENGEDPDEIVQDVIVELDWQAEEKAFENGWVRVSYSRNDRSASIEAPSERAVARTIKILGRELDLHIFKFEHEINGEYRHFDEEETERFLRRASVTNNKLASMKKFHLIGSCVSLDGDSINEMKDRPEADQVDVEDWIENCEDTEMWAKSMGYESAMAVDDDWAVTFWESFYEGVPCFYVTHSNIEHVWTENGRTSLAKNWYSKKIKTAATFNDLDDDDFWDLFAETLGSYRDGYDLRQEYLDAIYEEYGEDVDVNSIDLESVYINPGVSNAFDIALQEFQDGSKEYEFPYQDLLEQAEKHSQAIFAGLKDLYPVSEPYNWGTTGYVLPDGTGLDLNDGGFRFDHRSISPVMNEYLGDIIEPNAFARNTKFKLTLGGMGAMIVTPEAPGVMLFQPPTRQQLRWIHQMIKDSGSILLEYRDKGTINISAEEADYELYRLFG